MHAIKSVLLMLFSGVFSLSAWGADDSHSTSSYVVATVGAKEPPQILQTSVATKAKPVAQSYKRITPQTLQENPFDKLSLDKLQQKAEQGDIEAQFQLGLRYYQGIMVSKDYEQAFIWISKAAAQNHLRAQSYLGEMYARGQGVSKKYVDGAALLKKTAHAGDADGQYFLGMLYVDGIGVPKSPFRAMGWFEKAYEQNHIQAKGMVGFFLYRMSEAAHHKARATALMRESCEAGNEIACKNLRELLIRPTDLQ